MKYVLMSAASILVLGGICSHASVAFAQDVGQAAEGENAIAEVVVIGSRVATGADAPTPVTVVTTQAINQVALPNIADALIQLPALRSSTASSKGGQGVSIGSQLNLRNLAAVRTLVLVDGQRYIPTPGFATSQIQGVNVDNIPQGLIKRVETVTGGASAAYGSDAVAGVVNFVLDTKFEGLKGDVSYGQSSRNDGQKYGGVITAGGAFNDGKGHVVMDAEYYKDAGIQNDPFGVNPGRPFQSPAKTIGRERIGNSYVIIPNATLPVAPENSLVIGCTQAGTAFTATKGTSCPVYGTYFNNAGTATQVYNAGIRTSPTSVFANGGEGYNPGPQSVLSTPSTRSSVYARIGYDLTPKLNVYVNAQSSKTTSQSEGGSVTPTLIYSPGLPLASDYAYLPTNLATQMQTLGITSINVQKTFTFNVQQGFTNQLRRGRDLRLQR
jgi:iron complex outermembrane receptor protein